MARLINGLDNKRRDFAYKAFQQIPTPTTADVQLQLMTVEGLGGKKMGIGPIGVIRKLALANQPLPVKEVKPSKPRARKKSQPIVVTANVTSSGPTIVARAFSGFKTAARRLVFW
jgi:hypothetical protein